MLQKMLRRGLITYKDTGVKPLTPFSYHVLASLYAKVRLLPYKVPQPPTRPSTREVYVTPKGAKWFYDEFYKLSYEYVSTIYPFNQIVRLSNRFNFENKRLIVNTIVNYDIKDIVPKRPRNVLPARIKQYTDGVHYYWHLFKTIEDAFKQRDLWIKQGYNPDWLIVYKCKQKRRGVEWQLSTRPNNPKLPNNNIYHKGVRIDD